MHVKLFSDAAICIQSALRSVLARRCLIRCHAAARHIKAAALTFAAGALYGYVEFMITSRNWWWLHSQWIWCHHHG